MKKIKIREEIASACTPLLCCLSTYLLEKKNSDMQYLQTFDNKLTLPLDAVAAAALTLSVARLGEDMARS